MILGKFFHQIYILPAWFIIILILIALTIWRSCAAFADKKGALHIWRYINSVLLIMVLCVIVGMTLRNRSTPQNSITWDFWGKWEAAKRQPELYREMLMNVFLFVPFGLTMPFAVYNPRKRKCWPAVIVSIWFGFLFSALIECLQLVYSRGHAEPEDVICNTIGAVIGTISFILWAVIRFVKYRTLSKEKSGSDNNEKS